MAARPSVASMAPYASRPLTRSFFATGQLEAPLHPRQLGKQREFGTLDLARYILTFADRRAHRALSVVNRSWKHLATPFCQLPFLVSEGHIPGERGVYQLKRNLHCTEIEMIAGQTGLTLPLPHRAHLLTDISLGRGKSGELCIGYDVTKSHFVAIKIIRGEHSVRAEIMVQRELGRNPYILCPYEIISAISPEGEVSCYQMMDLAGLGSADKLKLDTLDPDFREMLLFHFAQGILQALHEMHRGDLCHLDFKPANFAATQEGRVVVIDFDCAAKMTRGKLDLREHDGDENTYSPERWLAGRLPDRRVCAGDKVDIWAAGLSLLALSGVNAIASFGKRALRPLVMGDAPEAALGRYVGETLGRLPAFRAPAPNSLAHLILQLLHPDPERRPTAEDALRHLWFAKMTRETAPHRDKITGYLREFVQAEQRHIHATPKTERTFDAYSPQGLPAPHFTSFVARLAIQTALDRKVFADIPYTTTAPLTVCQGAGGLGKTTLLAHLIHDPKTRSRFGLRLWFYESDRPERVQAQFVTLARELGLVEEKTVPEEAIRRLQYYLSTYPQRYGKPWIAVFDNADTPESLRPLLPSAGGHILVSTRVTWPDSIAVDVLTESEGLALVSKLLLRDDSQSPELCRALGYHALGLMQACAYIRNHRLPLTAFLEELSKSTKAVSADERLLGRSLPSSVSGLWQMTFEKLRARSPEAMAQLELYAYLAPERLPQLTFSEATTKLLKDYSLIQGREYLSIHRLLQMTLRAAHPVETQVAIAGRAMKLLESALDKGDTPQAKEHNRDLAPHGEMLRGHYDRLTEVPRSERVVEPLHAPLVDMMLWMDNVQARTASVFARRHMLEKTLALAVRLYGQEHVTVAGVKSRLGHALYNLGEYYRAIEYHEQALDIQIKVLEAEHPKVATSLNNLGAARSALGEHRRALEHYKQALVIQIKVLGPEHPDVAASLNNIGSAWLALGQPRQAIEYFEQALDIERNASGAEHLSIATYLHNIGVVRTVLGEPRRAIAYFEKARIIRRRALGAEHPDVAASLNNIGVVWNALGESHKAIEYLDQALIIRRKTLGAKHPDVATSLNNIGDAWKSLGRPHMAIKHHKQALAIRRKALGAEHPDVAISLNNIGKALYALGKYHQAIEHNQQALAILIKALGAEHPDVAASLHSIGYALFALGEYHQAIERFEQALAIQRKALGAGHPHVATSLNNLGCAWKALGGHRQALEYYEQALAIRRKAFTEGHPDTVNSLMGLGFVQKDLGYVARARASWTEAYQMALRLLGAEDPTTMACKKTLDC